MPRRPALPRRSPWRLPVGASRRAFNTTGWSELRLRCANRRVRATRAGRPGGPRLRGRRVGDGCDEGRRRRLRAAAARARPGRPHQRVGRARPRSEPCAVGPFPGGPGMSHPQDLSLREQAAAVASGALDPGELLDATLTRIDERDAALNSVVVRFPDEARQMLADAPQGPLHGVPVVVKDMFRLPWYAPRDGAPAEAAPPGESAVYRRLRDAGAVIVGIGQAHYWGAGSTGHVSAWGPVGNPWNPAHCAGGSSGGSASAVGARLAAARSEERR